MSVVTNNLFIYLFFFGAWQPVPIHFNLYEKELHQYSAKQSHFALHTTTQVWNDVCVNDIRIVLFEWTIPLRSQLIRPLFPKWLAEIHYGLILFISNVDLLMTLLDLNSIFVSDNVILAVVDFIKIFLSLKWKHKLKFLITSTLKYHITHRYIYIMINALFEPSDIPLDV